MSSQPGKADRYREITRWQAPWWVVTIYGPGLPADGASVRSQKKDELSRDAAILWGEHGLNPSRVDVAYDFGPDTDTDLADFWQAHTAMHDAIIKYNAAGLKITSALANRHHIPLRDIASVLCVSYWDASRLMANRQRPHYVFIEWPRKGLQRISPALAHAAAVAARQAGIIASDKLRPAGRSKG